MAPPQPRHVCSGNASDAEQQRAAAAEEKNGSFWSVCAASPSSRDAHAKVRAAAECAPLQGEHPLPRMAARPPAMPPMSVAPFGGGGRVHNVITMHWPDRRARTLG